MRKYAGASFGLPTPTGPHAVGSYRTKATSQGSTPDAPEVAIFYPAEPASDCTPPPYLFPATERAFLGDAPELFGAAPPAPDSLAPADAPAPAENPAAAPLSFTAPASAPYPSADSPFASAPMAADPILQARQILEGLDGIVHACEGATPLPGQHAAVLLLPGLAGFAESLTTIAQELASRDIIAIAVQADFANEGMLAESPGGFEGNIDTLVDDRVAAVNAVLAAISSGALAPKVGSIAASKVAVGGHSFGGQVALDVARTDRRVAAAISLDGGVSPRTRGTTLSKPILWVSAGPAAVQLRELRGRWLASPGLVALNMPAAVHDDVTDFPALTCVVPEAASLFANGPDARSTVVTAQLVARFSEEMVAMGGGAIARGLPLIEPIKAATLQEYASE